MNSHDTKDDQPTAEQIAHEKLMQQPDGYGSNTGECGDTIDFFIGVRDDSVEDACYLTDGCMFTHLAALAVSELVKGRSIERAWKLKPEHVIAAIPDLPTDHYHCAELAAGALYRALTDYRNNQQKPWARLYRTNKAGRL